MSPAQLEVEIRLLVVKLTRDLRYFPSQALMWRAMHGR
jgi:hypothetical protein